MRLHKLLTLIIVLGLSGLVWAERAPWQVDSKLVNEVRQVIRQHYIYPVSDQQLTKGLEGGEAALRSMVASLGDPRMLLRSPEEDAAIDLNCWYRAPQGIGVLLEGVVVKRVFRGHPAEEAGLRVGDRIVSVDSKKVDTLKEAMKLLPSRSLDPTPVNLVVRRDGETLHFPQVKRAPIVFPYVDSHVRDRIGYLTLHGFSDSAPAQWDDHLARLPLDELTALVIDLRETQSGYLQELCKIAGRLQPANSVVLHYRTRTETKTYRASRERLYQGRLVVLVSGKTRGHAEILAASLREQASAILVGEATAGDNLLTQYFPFSDGSSLKLPTHLGLSPRGIPLDQSLKPDFLCPSAEALKVTRKLLKRGPGPLC